MKKKGFLSRLFQKEEKEKPKPPEKDSPILSMPQIVMSRDSHVGSNSESLGEVDELFLRQQMLNNLSIEQVELIAQKFDMEPTQLEGGKGRKVMGLFTAVSQKNSLPQLVTYCEEIVPSVKWQK